jgi:hypothetical protein
MTQLRICEAESRNVSCCTLFFPPIWLEGGFATPISPAPVASARSIDLQQQVIRKDRFKKLAAALSAVSGAAADEAFVGEISAVAVVGEDHVLITQSLQLVAVDCQ